MSYDHYWIRAARLDPESFLAWGADVSSALTLFPPGFIRGNMGKGEAEITPTLVCFDGNAHPTSDDIRAAAAFLRHYGIGALANSLDLFAPNQVRSTSLGHSTFWIDRDWAAGSPISPDRYRCKCPTNQFPYDIAVTAALILFAHHFREARVMSDGDFSDWQPGQALVRQATGKDLPIPIGEHQIGWVEKPDLVRFAIWSREVAAVINAAGIPLAGPGGSGQPTITESEVAFNGVGADGYDPLHFAPDMFPLHAGWRLKTYDKPYGLIVAAALILWEYRFPYPYGGSYSAITTKSDPAIWHEARDLVEQATGIALNVQARRDLVVTQT